MAIAGLVVMTEPVSTDIVQNLLLEHYGITEVQPTVDRQRLVAVLETSSDTVESSIKGIQNLPHVLSVDIAYINYEDDMERVGHIPCAPYERKRHHNLENKV